MNLVEDLHNTHKLEYIGGHQYLVPKVSTACRQSSIKYLTYKSDGHTYGETVIQTLPAVNFIDLTNDEFHQYLLGKLKISI